MVHNGPSKIIGHGELWGANRRSVNQPPIIIDTDNISLPPHLACKRGIPLPRYVNTHSLQCSVERRSSHLTVYIPIGDLSLPPPPSMLPNRLYTLTLTRFYYNLPPICQNCVAVTNVCTVDTIIYFANALQNCTYSFSWTSTCYTDFFLILFHFDQPRICPK